MQDMKMVRRKRMLYERAIDDKKINLDLDRLLYLEEELANLNRAMDDLRRNKNVIAKQVAQGTFDRLELIEAGKINAQKLTEQTKKYKGIKREFDHLCLKIPGLPLPEVPVGENEQDNRELYKVGKVRDDTDELVDHMEIAEKHHMLDKEGAIAIAGHRAYALRNYGALLEMAVLRFAYDHILEKGFTPVQPPVLVREMAMTGTGYFPQGVDEAYCLEKDNLYLTGTAEVGMLALYAERVIEKANLPIRLFGMTTCFRREAGAHGRDTRGLYRVHQFQKVEQVIICEGDFEVARKEHEKLLQNAEEILRALELPYRVVECCTGELGLGQVRKLDIETWMPTRKKYCETHSCSNFLDFQARRLNIKYNTGEEKKKRYVYTLNNTAIATPRILIPLLENHQTDDGGIYVPRVLRKYLGGLEKIEL